MKACTIEWRGGNAYCLDCLQFHYGHTYSISQEMTLLAQQYRDLWKTREQAPEKEWRTFPMALQCINMGKLIDRSACGMEAWECRVHKETCVGWQEKACGGTMRYCGDCKDFINSSEQRVGGPYGVVIGSYGMPGVVELGIAAIRSTCGPDVPILVHDDATPFGEGRERILSIPRRHKGVELFVSTTSKGHANGDLQAFRRGLEWADQLKLKTLAKFSQRFILTTPGWLEQDSLAMIESGVALLSQKAYHLHMTFAMRTEAVLMNVAKCLPMVEDMRTRIAVSTEDQMRFLANKHNLTQGRWERIPPDRFQPATGVIWHNSEANDEYNGPARAYHDLAERLGVDLGPEFSGAGWHVIAPHRPNAQYRMF